MHYQEAFNRIHRKGKFDAFASYLLDTQEVQVNQNYTKWYTFGKRYREVARLAGGNRVLLVPSTIGRSTYIQLPLTYLISYTNPMFSRIEKKGKAGDPDIAAKFERQARDRVKD